VSVTDRFLFKAEPEKFIFVVLTNKVKKELKKIEEFSKINFK
jgi:hypothetical protein